uniref:Chaperone protein dnaJ n=1 Tax=Caligus clemensi TaxID=344056 RepID=C1C105_CALCM|nr:Chaperone protein dnaJ [Caligus clemensi]
MSKDYYSILEVSRQASESDIKKAYRRLALRYHPDKNNFAEAEDKFKEIAEAYEVLSNEDKRRDYDLLGRRNASFATNNNATPTYHRTFSFHPTDPFELFRSFFGVYDPFGGVVGRTDPFGLHAGSHFSAFGHQEDSLFARRLTDVKTTTYASSDGSTVHITRTLIGNDGSVRREMRFRASSPPPSVPRGKPDGGPAPRRSNSLHQPTRVRRTPSSKRPVPEGRETNGSASSNSRSTPPAPKPTGRDSPVPCPLCGEAFPRHEIQVHASSCEGSSDNAPGEEQEDKSVECPICNQNYPQALITRHAASCGDEMMTGHCSLC